MWGNDRHDVDSSSLGRDELVAFTSRKPALPIAIRHFENQMPML